MPLLEDVGYDQGLHEAMVERVRARGGDVPILIERLADGYVDLYDLSGVEEINHGMCEDFAADVKALVPRARVQWIDGMDHAVAVIDGRYYDAESARGR